MMAAGGRTESKRRRASKTHRAICSKTRQGLERDGEKAKGREGKWKKNTTFTTTLQV
jgi:hypothetical protein